MTVAYETLPARKPSHELAFPINVGRPGAWLVTLDIDHACASGTATYLRWEHEGDPLLSPFGPYEQGVLLKQGRHTYQFYISVWKGQVAARMYLGRAAENGWQTIPAEMPLLPPQAPTMFGDHTRIIAAQFTQPTETAAIPPNYVLIPVTSYCNYKCVMCAHGVGAVEKKEHYPDMLADHMVQHFRDAKHLMRVAMTGLGESLMSPVFFRMVDAVRNPLVRFHLCSNAALLTQKRVDWLMESPFSHLNVSLDAGNAVTYSKIRRADWDKVIRNLEAFSDTLAKTGRKDLRLILNMTLMKENVGDLKQFIDVAKHLRASAYVNQLIGCFTGWIVEHDGWKFEYADQVLQGDPVTVHALREASAYARSLGVSFKPDDMMRPLLDTANGMKPVTIQLPQVDEVSPLAQCPYPWTGDSDSTAVVNAEGKVHMCCMQQPFAQIEKGQTVADVWNGPAAKDIRRRILAGKVPQQCAGSNCWYVAKERSKVRWSLSQLKLR